MSRRQSAAEGAAAPAPGTSTGKSPTGRGAKPASRPSGAERRRAAAKAAAAAADPNAPTGILADVPPDGPAPAPFVGTAGRQKRPFGLQPFAWGSLQILPLAAAAAASVAAIPPPLPGMTRSAVFR